MSEEEQLLDALHRMKFLQADAQRLHDAVVGQEFRTEEQCIEMDMLASIGDEIGAEVEKLTTPKPPATVCRYCGKPSHRSHGLWLHVNSEDFAKCGCAAIPRGEHYGQI
jgi:hypothetical protein